MIPYVDRKEEMKTAKVATYKCKECDYTSDDDYTVLVHFRINHLSKEISTFCGRDWFKFDSAERFVEYIRVTYGRSNTSWGTRFVPGWYTFEIDTSDYSGDVAFEFFTIAQMIDKNNAEINNLYTYNQKLRDILSIQSGDSI
jgi:hypothetical protein